MISAFDLSQTVRGSGFVFSAFDLSQTVRDAPDLCLVLSISVRLSEVCKILLENKIQKQKITS